MVAIFTNSPISDWKKKKMIKVPEVSIKIQNRYPVVFLLLNIKSEVFFIALGEASNVVSEVLNIVVKAAIAMI